MYQFDPKKLKHLLSVKNLSQAELSRRLNVSRSSVSRILRGERKPGSDFIAALNSAFPDIPLEYFFSQSVAKDI